MANAQPYKKMMIIKLNVSKIKVIKTLTDSQSAFMSPSSSPSEDEEMAHPSSSPASSKDHNSGGNSIGPVLWDRRMNNVVSIGKQNNYIHLPRSQIFVSRRVEIRASGLACRK